VTTAADLEIALTSDADVYKPSTIIQYRITVTNQSAIGSSRSGSRTLA
jgi:hypothetical protein